MEFLGTNHWCLAHLFNAICPVEVALPEQWGTVAAPRQQKLRRISNNPTCFNPSLLALCISLTFSLCSNSRHPTSTTPNTEYTDRIRLIPITPSIATRLRHHVSSSSSWRPWSGPLWRWQPAWRQPPTTASRPRVRRRTWIWRPSGIRPETTSHPAALWREAGRRPWWRTKGAAAGGKGCRQDSASEINL